MNHTSNIRASVEVDAMLARWFEAVEPFFDTSHSLFIDPAAKMRPAWSYKAGAANGGLHNGSQLSLYYAVSLFRLGRDLERARSMVGVILDLQERDASKPNYGNYRHLFELEAPSDLNSIFFANFGLLVIAKEYGTALQEPLSARIDESFAISLFDIRKGDDEADIAYTNASLGRIACGILMAEHLGDKEAAELLLARFDLICEVNQARGIAERLSDTYYMVNIMAMGMILAYGNDQPSRTKAAGLLRIFLRELRFFSHRQPVPARRTYNQEMGDAVKFTVLDWLLGDITAEQYMEGISRRSHDEEPLSVFRMHSGWLALLEPVLRRIPEHLAEPPLPAEPRLMQGKLVDDSHYCSYYHRDYSLGSFSDYPTSNLRHQHVSDMPVAFSGDVGDLGFVGMYAIDEHNILHSNPGRYVEQKKEAGAHHGMPGTYRPAVIRSAAHQVNNLCMAFYDLDDLFARVRELGVLLRVPRFTGALCDETGRRLEPGRGSIPGRWCFLDHGTYHVALRALDHFDPEAKAMRQTSFDYINENGHLQLFLPNLKSPAPIEVACDSILAGIIILCCSARTIGLNELIGSLSQWKISEQWEDDGYTYRGGENEFVRRVSVETRRGNLSMSYDYRLNRVVERTSDGEAVDTPAGLCCIERGGEELY